MSYDLRRGAILPLSNDGGRAVGKGLKSESDVRRGYKLKCLPISDPNVDCVSKGTAGEFKSEIVHAVHICM